MALAVRRASQPAIQFEMKKQLILLAGLHKTGTSSIQQTCLAHRTLLKRAGVVFPVHSRPALQGTFVDSNHTFVLGAMFRKRPIGQLTDVHATGVRQNIEARTEAGRSAFDSLISRLEQDTLLMAAEGVSILTREELLDLKNWFNGRDFGIRLLCCIRSPFSWLNAMIDQRVAGAHGPHLTIRASLEQFENISGIVRPRVLNIMSAFPDAEFYSFKSAVSHPAGPVGYFLDRTGIKMSEEITPVRANEGRSAHSVRIWTLINEGIGLQTRNDAQYISFLARIRPALNSLAGKKFALTRDELAGLLPVLEEENRWLDDNFGEEYCDDRLELSNDLPSLDEITRRRLQAMAVTAEPRVRQAIDGYLAACDQVRKQG